MEKVINKSREEILSTEYSPKFDELRKNRMVASYYKYGPVAQNAGEGRIDEIRSLEKRLAAYKQTGNTEYLVDVANFAMIEFMFPIHPNAHFEGTDSDRSPGLIGTPVNMEYSGITG